MNSWPEGRRKALTQVEHKNWNSKNYPGTRQLCLVCESPTERCEEDDLRLEDGYGPLCDDCYVQLTED
jgi:hypothetical protein